MRTLNSNYTKNIDILKENLRRGMSNEQAQNAINAQENQFINAGLYNEMEKNYINEMRGAMIEFFTHISIAL